MPSAPVPSQREKFFAFCQSHLKARGKGRFISDQASRLLLVYVKQYMEKLPQRDRNLDSVTRAVLDKFPEKEKRIDRDVLEKYELVARSVEYAVSATGDVFKYRAILQESIIGGVAKVLVEWEPTWEPISNIPKSALKKHHDKTRSKRKATRRAKVLLEGAHTPK